MLADKSEASQKSMNLADELGIRSDFGKSAHLDKDGRLLVSLGKDFGVAQFAQDGSLVFMPPNKPRNQAVCEEITFADGR